MGAQTHSNLGCSCAGVWRLQDTLSFLSSSSQACQGSRRRSTGRQSDLGFFFQFSAHAILSSPRILQTPEILLGLLGHIICLWSCYQTPNHDSFLPIGNGRSSKLHGQLLSHAQKCSGCQVAWIKSETRTSPKCEWQCLCSDSYVIQPISIEVDFIKRLHDNAFVGQSFLWERSLATKMAFPV